MKKKTTTPHDATFRQFLTQPDIARDFMELHLPADAAGHLRPQDTEA